MSEHSTDDVDLEDVTDRADRIETYLLDRLEGRDQLVVRGGRVADALGMDIAGFVSGFRRLREREDAAIEFERWSSENSGSPWLVRRVQEVPA